MLVWKEMYLINKNEAGYTTNETTTRLLLYYVKNVIVISNKSKESLTESPTNNTALIVKLKKNCLVNFLFINTVYFPIGIFFIYWNSLYWKIPLGHYTNSTIENTSISN